MVFSGSVLFHLRYTSLTWIYINLMHHNTIPQGVIASKITSHNSLKQFSCFYFLCAFLYSKKIEFHFEIITPFFKLRTIYNWNMCLFVCVPVIFLTNTSDNVCQKNLRQTKKYFSLKKLPSFLRSSHFKMKKKLQFVFMHKMFLRPLYKKKKAMNLQFE